MNITTNIEDTHSYRSVILCNNIYYCYDRAIDREEAIDIILMLEDEGYFVVEEISEGRYHVID